MGIPKGYYVWHKVGDKGVEVYEGRNCITFGRGSYYIVFANKAGSRVDEDGNWKIGNYHNSYAGEYKTKGEASKLIKKIDKGIYTKGIDIIKLNPTHPKSGKPRAFYINNSDIKSDSGAIVVMKDDKLGLEHELGHARAGHFKNNKHGYRAELEADKEMIAKLRDKGEYNSGIRNRIVSSLSTHSRHKNPKEKARRDIKRIEARLGM